MDPIPMCVCVGGVVSPHEHKQFGLSEIVPDPTD